jgi:pyrroloquinoline quinone biosynthesis protein B
LLCASPDLRQQVLSARELGPPADASFPSPIGGVFLPGADVDSVMGLLHLREFQSFFVFATHGVRCVLQKENRIFRVLERANPPVKWQTLSAKGRLGCHLSEDSSGPADFICSTVPLGGCYPDYVSEETLRAVPPEDASVGFVMEQGEKRLFFAPSVSGHSAIWKSAAETANVSFVDGTFWSDDELMSTGRSQKSAREIGHLPLSGPGGLLEQFPSDAKGRKILIHINNTNPILDEGSAEHRAVLDAGFEIAYDGMEFEL